MSSPSEAILESKWGFNVGEVVIALGVVSTLFLMIFPLPRLLLDILISFNITFSLMVLLLALYLVKPIEFFIFPSMLLITTLFRLSINVATTRLILLNAQDGMEAAGGVIKTFGNFVVGGNFIVGGVLFVILVLINLKVIVAGSTRIAEVAARFTLDALPGKQMAVDADMNAGNISEAEAKERRETLRREGEFYGAMDGASKFVSGEAKAGVMIMLINVIGGLLIGTLMYGMDIMEAAKTFTILTMGDGLVTQIPALFISTSAGVVVSKASSQDTLGKEYAKQFKVKPQAMAMAAVIIFFLGITPGLPHLPFLILAVTTGGLAYMAYQSKEKDAVDKQKIEEEAKKIPKGPEQVESLLPLDILELEVGYGLIPLVDEEQDGELLERIRAIRRQFALEMGIVVPPLHIRDNLQLKPGGYQVLIKGVEVANAELMIGYHLAIDPGDTLRKMDGLATLEPTFNLPALWIPESKKEEAQHYGYTVVDLASVVATHLTEVIRQHADDLLGRQEVQRLLDQLAKTNPKVVEELVPNQLSLGVVQKVLQNLIRERISIRNMLSIAETLADYAVYTKDPDILSEYVRQKLARAFVKPLESADRTISVYTLDPALDDLIKNSLQKTDYGTYLAIDPNTSQKIIASLGKAADRVMALNIPPVIVSSPLVRRHLRHLIERQLPALTVLSHHELVTEANLVSLGVVGMNYEA
jgi:flagellar biosynthesis protein FlhA